MRSRILARTLPRSWLVVSRARKQAMPDRPKNTPLRSWLVVSRARKQAMPDRPKNTPLRSWLVARRARKQAMPQSPEKSLPCGRGSLRAARVSKRCPIARKTLPYGRGSLRAARVSKRCPIARKTLPYGRGSLRAARVRKRCPIARKTLPYGRGSFDVEDQKSLVHVVECAAPCPKHPGRVPVIHAHRRGEKHQKFGKPRLTPLPSLVGVVMLDVRAESQQTAIAVLDHEPARVPWHVGNPPREFHALSCVLGIKYIGIFDEQVRVQQFVPVFVRIGGGRLGAAEVNHLLVARNDCIDRRIKPRPQTFETKLFFVIGERSGDVHGEEQGRNLANHVPSLLQISPDKDCLNRWAWFEIGHPRCPVSARETFFPVTWAEAPPTSGWC